MADGNVGTASTNRLLMELLSLLSRATGLVAAHLRGNAPPLPDPVVEDPPEVDAPLQVLAPTAVSEKAEAREARSAAAVAAESPLDRIQKWEPGAAVEEAPSPGRGRRRGRGRLDVSPEELKRLYVDEGLTAKAIGEKFGVSHGTVAQRVMKLGLSKRGPSPMRGRRKKGK